VFCLALFLLQLMKLIDLLVSLTVSEEEIYPLIQSQVWSKIGHEADLLKKVRQANGRLWDS